jgi:hypothetical protein
MLSRRKGLKVTQKSQIKKEFTRELHKWFQSLWDRIIPESRKCLICGIPLVGENKTIYWDHLIEKTNRKDIAFETWNILLVCGDCHSNRHNGIIPDKYQEWIDFAKEVDKRAQIKKEGN